MAITGTIGDGTTDDTTALQSWLDSGSSETPDGTETYRITQQLEINQTGSQTVDFNGTTVTVTVNSNFYAFQISKSDRATTTIVDLILDGNDLLRNGFDVDSPINATNVDILDLYDADDSVIAWNVSINATQGYGTYNWDGCDITNIHSLSNASTGDAQGSTRCYDVQWTANPPSTTVLTIDNFIWDGVYGEDGGPIRIDDAAAGVEFSGTLHKTVLKNGEVKNFIRRGMKIGCDNVEVYNTSFVYAEASNPKYENNPAGLIGVRPLGNDPNGALNNIVFNGCTFDNTSYAWAIIDKMDGVEISNCTFLNGAGIRIDNLSDSFMGDWTICNTTFSATSVIKDQNIGTGAGTGQLAGTTLTYDTGNSRTAASVITFDNSSVDNVYTYSAIAVTDCPAVNFSTYGAVGNGITDDTAAIQSALDAEIDLIADLNATFLISSKLDIDQGFVHTIDWNGATIKTNSTLNPMMLVDKRTTNGGRTTMSNLIVDGNLTATRGVQVNSKVTFTNVNATGFRQPTSVSPAGFYLNFYNDSDAHGDWIFDGCDVDNLIGASNGSTTDSWGAANGYLIYVRQLPSSTTTLKISNATVHDCWGEDAQTIALFSPGIDTSNSNWSFEGTSLNLYNWERRCVKGFLGNQTWLNCTFTDPDPSDPNLYSSNKSGLFVIGAGSGATGGSNNVVEGCSFVSRGYDGRVIVVGDVYAVTDIAFNNSEWSGGADILFYKKIGNVDICSSVFGAGSIANDYGTLVDSGELRFDTNNTYVESGFFSALNVLSYIETPLTCTPIGGSGNVTDITWNDTTQSINSGETVDTGFSFTPSNPSDSGYILSSSNSGVLSDTGAWVNSGSANLTITADDTTNGTITDVMFVTTNASDGDAPIVETIEAYDITETTFYLTWILNEPSKGWVLYGTSSDLSAPYVYDQETTHENSFTYSTHIQPVGGNTEDNTDPLLVNGTTYYCRIYTEDVSGNIGYSDEFTVTTLSDIPVITLNGSTPVNLTVGSIYTELGATWTDIQDGSGSAEITGSVDSGSVGQYLITYNHMDTDLNAADEVTRTVNVLESASSIETSFTTMNPNISYNFGNNNTSDFYIGSNKIN